MRWKTTPAFHRCAKYSLGSRNISEVHELPVEEKFSENLNRRHIPSQTILQKPNNHLLINIYFRDFARNKF